MQTLPTQSTALSELAELYGKQNKFADADPLYVRIVSAKEKRDSHGLSMASVLSAQAGNYVKENKFAEAQAAYERALAIREKAQGAENKDVATVLEGLSQTMVKQEKLPKPNLWRDVAWQFVKKPLAPTAQPSALL